MSLKKEQVFIALFILPALFFLLSTPCLSAEKIDQITIGTTMEVKGLSIDDYYFGIMRAMLTHLGLIKLNEKGEFTGDLAQSWETDDARVWTFHIRPGLTWHDGTPVSSEDVKFSIEYLREKIPVYAYHFKLVIGVEALDPNTVIIRLSEPNPRILVNLLVLRTIPKHIFQGIDDPKVFHQPQAAIGCGPYVFEKFDPAAGLVSFKYYDGFYRGRPNVNRVVFRMFKNPDTMYMALKKGEIDLPYFYAAGADPAHVSALIKEKNIAIDRIKNLGVPNAIFFNTSKAPLDQKRFRKALSYAVDYQEMVRLFAGGYGWTPKAGFVPEGSADYIDTEPLVYNPGKARALLKELGYTEKTRDGLLEKDGRALELELIVRTDTAASMRLAELLKRRFKTAGVALKIRPVDTTLFRQISDNERSHVLLLSRTTPWGMMMWAGCGTGYFDSRNIGWSVLNDSRFTSIVDRMNTTLVAEEYKSAAADLQRYYAENLPALPLYWNALIQPHLKKYQGWKVSPMYGYLWENTWYSLTEQD
ncbi:MAG: ABC transporter substrate-binding protein [Deltaproteobacteria bacterium]|nr:ABC transporter substrate-binding protein [Deltaproteobacteria bacterium]